MPPKYAPVCVDLSCSLIFSLLMFYVYRPITLYMHLISSYLSVADFEQNRLKLIVNTDVNPCMLCYSYDLYYTPWGKINPCKVNVHATKPQQTAWARWIGLMNAINVSCECDVRLSRNTALLSLYFVYDFHNKSYIRPILLSLSKQSSRNISRLLFYIQLKTSWQFLHHHSTPLTAACTSSSVLQWKIDFLLANCVIIRYRWTEQQ